MNEFLIEKMKMSDNLNAYSAMSGVVILWAISWPLGRVVATGGLGANPIFAAFLRYLIAIPFLFLFMKIFGNNLAYPKKYTKAMIIFGVLHVTLYNFFFLSSLRYTSSSDAVLILNAAIAVMSAVLASIVYDDEKLNRKRIFGLGITMIGVLIVFIASPNTDVENPLLGNMIILLAALVWSIYTVYSRDYYEEIKPLPFQFWTTIWGWLFLGIFAIFEVIIINDFSIDITTYGALLYLGVFGAAIPNTLFSKSINHIGPTRTSIIINLIPLMSIFASIILIGEEFSISYLYSFFLMMIGIYFVNK